MKMNKKYLNTYYNPDWVFDHITEYFCIEEFISPIVLAKHGQAQSWSFLDFRMLSNLLFIRKRLNKKITANDYKWGGKFKERCVRSIRSSIVMKYIIKGILYMSAHIRAGAIDFDVKDMAAWKVRDWIHEHSEQLPYPCRLEDKYASTGEPIPWVHMDVDYSPYYKDVKVYRFNV